VIPLTGLAMPHLCACPMPGHGFLILSWSFYAQLFMSGGFYFVGVVDRGSPTAIQIKTLKKNLHTFASTKNKSLHTIT
jgi:hypothetical protein